MRGCSFLPDGRMALSCVDTNTVRFINKEGVELLVKLKQDPILLIQFILIIKIALRYRLDGEIMDV